MPRCLLYIAFLFLLLLLHCRLSNGFARFSIPCHRQILFSFDDHSQFSIRAHFLLAAWLSCARVRFILSQDCDASLMDHFPCTISSIIITTVLTLLYSTRELCYAWISFIPSVQLDTQHHLSFSLLSSTSYYKQAKAKAIYFPNLHQHQQLKGYCTVHQNTVTAPYFICWHSMYPFGWSISILITVVSLPFHRIHILFMHWNMSIVLIGYLAF